MRYAILFSLALAASPAMAEDYHPGQSTNLHNASAICFPALPVYDGNVRKRPLAVVNEGNKPSFVTCGYTVDEYAADDFGGVENFDTRVRNDSPVTATVKCTAVIGVEGEAQYIAKQATLPAGGTAVLEWKSTDYDLPKGFDGPVSMSCLLPVGTALNESRVHFDYFDRFN